MFSVWTSTTRARLFAVSAQSSGMEVNNELLGDQNNMKSPNAVSCFVGAGQSLEALNQWLTGLILRLPPSNLRVVCVHRRKIIIVKKWCGGLGSEKGRSWRLPIGRRGFYKRTTKAISFLGERRWFEPDRFPKNRPRLNQDSRERQQILRQGTLRSLWGYPVN